MANNNNESAPMKMDVQVGVPEGRRAHNYDSNENHFAYCHNSVDLYEDEDGEVIEFEHFIEPVLFKDRHPKAYPIFDYRLIDNLTDMNITSMRHPQIATMMAAFFEPPEPQLGPPDLVCISTTGSGKTIAYLVAAIQKCIDRNKMIPSETKRTPAVLIFVNSLPLAVKAFQTAIKLSNGIDIKIELIAGSTKFIKTTYFDIGVCTPGRFQNHLSDSKTKDIKIDTSDLELLVIDEADEIVKFNEFQDIFHKIKESAAADFSTLWYSATVNSNVLSMANQKNLYEFGGGSINKVSDSVTTAFWQINSRSISKITGAIEGTPSIGKYGPHEVRHPFDALFHFLQEKLFNVPENKKKVIVFVKRYNFADCLALRLSRYGYSAVSIHGRHVPAIREKFMEEFISGKCRILIATDLLTRGTDFNVEYVVNYDLPLDYHQWIHRCGRTGRNGILGIAITFVDKNNPEDYPVNTLQQIAFNSNEYIPEFMIPFVEMAKKEKEANKQHLNENVEEYGMQ